MQHETIKPLVKLTCKTPGCGATVKTRKPKPDGNPCFRCWMKERGEEVVAAKGEDGSLQISSRKIETR